jgi:thiol:disulfide interchange protein DsbC
MTSRSLAASTLVSAALLSLATTAFGEAVEATPAERLLATLKERYPATPFTRVQNTPVPGLYEVVFGNNIAYAADDGRHFLFGHLLDLQTQRDLTAANAPPTTPRPAPPVAFAATARRRSRPSAATAAVCWRCSAIPIARIAMSSRSSWRRSTAPPSTPFCCRWPRCTCRRADKAIPSGAPPIAPAPGALMLEGQPPPSKTCAHPLERNRALATQLAVRGTPTLIAGDGRVAVGVLSAAELAAWLDAGSETQGAATVLEDGR